VASELESEGLMAEEAPVVQAQVRGKHFIHTVNLIIHTHTQLHTLLFKRLGLFFFIYIYF